jgi:hypothetical protein
MSLLKNSHNRAKTPTKTVFCVACGPSLTKEDCVAVQNTGCSIIAVNNAWQLFDEIHALYAGDLAWWKRYREELPRGQFRKVTANIAAAKSYGLEYRRYCDAREGFNSGAMAISLAAELGAEEVILLGYDCSISRGTHWHGPHDGKLRNPTEVSVRYWHQQFQATKERHPTLHIFNASRSSEIQCFPRINLEAVIAQLSSEVAPAQ